MDREQFKQRMKSLKSYRELNPGKGYWDWKIEEFLPGGEIDNNTPMWLELSYNGPTYNLVLESLKRDDPQAYNLLAEARAKELLSNSEIVRYVDANGNIATASNAQGLLPVLTPEDLPGIGDAAEVYNIGKDVVEGNYGSALAGLGLLAIPGRITNKIHKFIKYRTDPRVKHLLDIRRLYDEYSPLIATIENISKYNPEILKDRDILLLLKAVDYDVLKGRILLENDALHPIFELATHTKRFKQAYPNGYGITYRGINYYPNQENKLYTGYGNAVFTIKDSDRKIHSYYGGSKGNKYTDNSFKEPYIEGLNDLSSGGVYLLIYPKDAPIETIDAKNHSFTDLDFLNRKWRDTDEFAEGVSSGELPSVIFKNIYDPHLILEELIYRNIPGLYLKSALGSSLKFDLNSPELFLDGGEVPPDNSPVYVNPFTGKPIANGMVYTTIPSRMSSPEELLEAAETALSFIPYVGDAISVKDLTQSINNKDWIGASLAGLSLIPFVPRLWRSKTPKVSRPVPDYNPNYFLEAMEKAEKIWDKRKLTVSDFYTQQDAAYESLIESEDAFRRAVSVDRAAGTDYKKVYEDYIRKYSKGSSRNNDDLALIRITDDMPSGTKATVSSRDLDWINVNERYVDPSELDPTFLKMNPGLVRHELGHITDEKAGLDYVDKLGKRSKFESEEKLREMYPSSYKTIQSYLLRGSEIKSHMNEFREFLRSKHEDGVKETVRSMREKLDKYRDEFRNLKVLFDAYKSKRQFVKDYNTIPLIGTSALGINYYLNQLEEK